MVTVGVLVTMRITYQKQAHSTRGHSLLILLNDLNPIFLLNKMIMCIICPWGIFIHNLHLSMANTYRFLKSVTHGRDKLEGFKEALGNFTSGLSVVSERCPLWQAGHERPQAEALLHWG